MDRPARSWPGKNWRRLAALAVTLPLIGLGGTTSAGASSADLQEATRFRVEFGLTADPSFVADLARDPGAESDRYGVPLTSSEEALMVRRDQIQEELGPIRAFGRANPSTFAGLWLAYPPGGDSEHALVLNANVTGDVERYEDDHRRHSRLHKLRAPGL